MDSTPPDTVENLHELGQQTQPPSVSNNTRFLASCNYSSTTCLTGTNQNRSHTFQAMFDTDDAYSGIDNRFLFDISHTKQDYVIHLRKGRRNINIFEGPKVHTIYEGTITWNIENYTRHPHRVEIPKSLYVLNRREHLISNQNWAQNAPSANVDATTLNGTWCATNHNHATLIWGGGSFIHTMTLYKHNIFTLQTAPGYTAFTFYCNTVGY